MEYYTFLEITRTQIPFFKWYELIKDTSKDVNMILRNDKEIGTKILKPSNPRIIDSWQDGKARVIEKIHPPLQEIKISIKETQITASLFKIKIDRPEISNGRYIKNIIE